VDRYAPPIVEHVRIFDTTLRDGEQSPGCTMSPAEKLEVARQLARLGVDVIEAGFPAASPGDAAAVHAIAEAFRDASSPVICGLARATESDVDACVAAIAPAARPRVHVFLATSNIHLEHKLRCTRAELTARARDAVALARARVDDVEFSPEDATRSDPEFLLDVLAAVIEAGATTINVPDTVGYATPDEYAELIERVCALTSRTPGVVVSAHCHDDLGLAVANTLAGVRAGARQVECTINGIGERAGNASLEEVVMALHTRADRFGIGTRIDTRELMRTSRMVSACSGVHVAPNKAIVGANAFAHEAGIHQDGMLKHSSTYEIMAPETVGADGSTLVLGKHSGRHALRARLGAMGHDVDEKRFPDIFLRFKDLADRKKTVSDRDLTALLEGMTLPRTLFQKLWDRHVVRAETPATPAVLYVDLHLVHEVTSAQAFTELRERGLSVRAPHRTIATMDHSTPTTRGGFAALPIRDASTEARFAQVEQLSRNCQAFGIPLLALGDDRQGIVHVIGPELGLTQPGMTVVCGDSHTSTHGAFGALAFGIGTSQVAHVLASQCLLQTQPKTLEVRIEGRLARGVSAKDVILAVCARLGVGGATGHVIEYRGDVIRALSMEERMTVCNMSIEVGARAGMIAPDETTFAYLRGRPHAPRGATWDTALAEWRNLVTDDGAQFDRSIVIDGNTIVPMITYGTNPGMGMAITDAIPDPDRLDDRSERENAHRALRYMGLEAGKPLAGKAVDVVFVGSCTNSRISDLRDAASVLRGRRVAAGVRALVVPGSQQVKRQAESEGLDRIFIDAGAEWRESGCSMCIAMNGDQLRPGQLAVSTSNRNFEGRQGSGGRTLLASPLTAAAAAVTGVITDPRTLMGGVA